MALVEHTGYVVFMEEHEGKGTNDSTLTVLMVEVGDGAIKEMTGSTHDFRDLAEVQVEDRVKFTFKDLSEAELDSFFIDDQ